MTFEDPNREAVGVPPIWEGADPPADEPVEEDGDELEEGNS